MSDTAISSHRNGGCGCGGHGARHQHHHIGGSCHHEEKPAAGHHQCGCRGVRTLRRTHAALGVLLIVFLFAHLGIAALALVPPRYDAAASLLRSIAARYPVLEIALFAVLAAQAVTGLWLLKRSGLSFNASRCGGESPMRYFLQRWSGVVLLAFLALHLVTARWQAAPDFAGARQALLIGHPAMALFYVFAVAAVAFHAGNGIWTGAMAWGLRERIKPLWITLSLAAALVLAIAGAAAVGAFYQGE